MRGYTECTAFKRWSTTILQWTDLHAGSTRLLCVVQGGHVPLFRSFHGGTHLAQCDHSIGVRVGTEYAFNFFELQTFSVLLVHQSAVCMCATASRSATPLIKAAMAAAAKINSTNPQHQRQKHTPLGKKIRARHFRSFLIADISDRA